ncbi:uncharacterized protein LOC124634289 [Helicoverpa zea]|uniref:uncharacterized protein LOC124634289 n=1 Tax=Helicoverpa zea TaxID=7113 RepID=UPI001F581148|nr:uncharacterized protein LOC124634289 [Helicoverpa zea]
MSTPARSRAHRLSYRRCINCSLLLASNLRRYTVEELNEQMTVLLRTWTTPTPVTSDDILCIECYLLLQERILSNITGSHEDISPAYGHLNVCYGCGISVASRRTHRVELDCPQRSMILRWTLAHLVPHLQKVCIPCWLAATRETRRLEVQDSNRPARVMDAALSSLEDPEIPEPPPMPAPTSQPQQALRVQSKINSQKYKRVAAASRHCMFVGCDNDERLLVPMTIKELLLLQYNIYIPLNARICHHHLYSNQWDELTTNLNDFTSFQVDDIFSILERASQRSLDFNNIAAMDAHLRHYWLGLTEMQFNEILNSLPTLHNKVRNPSLALSTFLVKLRTGDSNQRLATLFQLPRSTLEKKMNIVRECLKEHFVPMHLGVNHTNIQNVASRNRIIPEGLFGDSSMAPDSKPAIVICDGTYVYVQSSSNYKYQKQTYSLHKYNNLVKPFLITCCDGYILECIGPYEATKNDSTIMSDLFRNESGPMRSFFRQGDVFILDRGFRDVIPELQSYNYKTYMPESLLEGEFQLTTDQANKSRCVTMCRWVVEIVNGRIKRDYKLFRQEYFNRASTHLMDDFKIVCALLNKFHPTIEDRPDAAEYVQIAQARLNSSNYLGEFIRRDNINRRRTVFQNIDSNAPHLDHFPRLTLDDLRRFALGSYQLKQARSYYGEHIRSNGTYNVEVSNDVLEEDLPLILGQNNYLIRTRIKSRHVSHKTYYSYLLISRDEDRANSLESIIAYYCNCLVGNRTVGCCAHTMTVLWYLSWGRFNNVSAPAQSLDEIFYEE